MEVLMLMAEETGFELSLVYYHLIFGLVPC
jgi:hypothetical protein